METYTVGDGTYTIEIQETSASLVELKVTKTSSGVIIHTAVGKQEWRWQMLSNAFELYGCENDLKKKP